MVEDKNQWPKCKYLARRTCGLELNEYSKSVPLPHIILTSPEQGRVWTSRVSSRPSGVYKHITEYSTASITSGFVELVPQQKFVKSLRVLDNPKEPNKLPPEDFEKLRAGKLPMLRPIWRGMNPYF